MRTVSLCPPLLASLLLACGASPDAIEVSGAGEREEQSLIGGRLARAGELDATLRLRDAFCTGTKVGPRHILTAAHCVSSFAPGSSLEVTNAKGFGSFGSQASGFRAYTIAQVEVEPAWRAACPPGRCGGLSVGVRNRMADVALVVTTADIAGVPVAPIDLSPVADGEAVTIAGYGCEVTVDGAWDPASGRLRLAGTRTIGFDAVVHPGSFMYPSDRDNGVLDLMKTIYAVTPGPGWSGSLGPAPAPNPSPSPTSSPAATPGPIPFPYWFADVMTPSPSPTPSTPSAPLPLPGWFGGFSTEGGSAETATPAAAAPAPVDAAGGVCPGDSGGPLYRTSGGAPAVVGVNGKHTFSGGTPYWELGYSYGGVPTTNWHARVDASGGVRAGAWLRALGVSTVCSAGGC